MVEDFNKVKEFHYFLLLNYLQAQILYKYTIVSEIGHKA